MEIPRIGRLKSYRDGLVGKTCPHCAAKIFPPHGISSLCGRGAKTTYAFSGKGEVYSYTIRFEVLTGFDEPTPHKVAPGNSWRGGG